MEIRKLLSAKKVIGFPLTFFVKTHKHYSFILFFLKMRVTLKNSSILRMHKRKKMREVFKRYSIPQKFSNHRNAIVVRLSACLFFILFFLTAPTVSAQHGDTTISISQLKKMSLEELMNIEVVTVSKFRQNNLEAPASIMVITEQQIKERGYLFLDDVLRDIPGVDLIHTYGQAPTISMFRGMHGDENRRMLFLIDGIVENSILGTFEQGGTAYSLFNVQQIEIILGPASALYGANAFSAVVNLITKKGEDVNGLHYQRGQGSFNTKFENILMGLKKGKFNIALSGSLYNTDGPKFKNRHPQYSNSYVDDAFSINSKLIYTLPKITTTLGFKTYHSSVGTGLLTTSPTLIYGLPNQGNLNTGIAGFLQTDFNGEHASRASPFATTAYWLTDFKINSKLNLVFKAQYRETGLSENSYVYTQSPGRNFINRHKFAHFSNRVKAELSGNYEVDDQQLVSAGLQFSQDNLEKGLRTYFADNVFDTIENLRVTNLGAVFKPRDIVIQNNWGAYLQTVRNLNILKQTSVSVGARFDHNNIYGNTFNPKIGFTNNINKQLTLKLLFGTAYRAPTNFEIFTTGGTRIANLDLKPERIRTYEFYLSYRPSKSTNFKAVLFRNQLYDVIVQDVPIGGGLFQNKNTGKTTINGIEAGVDYIPNTSYSGFINLTLQEGTTFDGTKNSDIPTIADFKWNIGSSFSVFKFLDISWITNVVSSRTVPATNPLKKIKGYSSSNLNIKTRAFFNDRVSASVRIDNLFDRKYYDPGVRAANGNFYPTVMEQPGIRGFIRLDLYLF
ncbi:MAG: TonB-dependent receptor [Chitinophagaceae bacterium]|nr:MAG: TonB-dependent receptor [Chitinophagaceae bacterium]